MASIPPTAAGVTPAASNPAAVPPFSWNIFANLAKLSGMTALQTANWVDKYWFRLAFQLILYAGGALILAMALNRWNLYPANGWIGIALVAIGFITLLSIRFTIPAALLATSKDIKFKHYLQSVAHVMLFVGMVFLVLSMVKIHSFLALGIFLLGLMLFGLWSLAYMRATGVYATISLGIIILAVIVSGAKAVTYVSPQAASLQEAMQTWENSLNEEEAARLDSLQEKRMAGTLSVAEQLEWNRLQENERSRGFFAGVRARLVTLADVTKKDVRVTTLQPRILGGLDDLPDGCYTFRTEGPVVMAGTEPQWLHADLRLNGKRPGERICFDALSPPVMSFATGIPSNVALPQTITISFTWAP